MGQAIPDELATYVTITWGDILRGMYMTYNIMDIEYLISDTLTSLGINRGDALPSTAQLPHGDPNFPEARRVRLAMALFLPALQEEVDQMYTNAQLPTRANIPSTNNGMISHLSFSTIPIC